MTWPFENDTSNIEKKLAKRSLHHERQRNLFAIIALVLTAFMITATFSIGFSYFETYQMQQIRLMGTTADVGITNVTENQLVDISKSNLVLDVGIQQRLGSVDTEQLQNARLGIVWIDDTEWGTHRLPTISSVVGNYPSSKNEIMLPTWVLEQMGISDPQIGMEIVLSYQIGDSYNYVSDTFLLSGYYTDYIPMRTNNRGYCRKNGYKSIIEIIQNNYFVLSNLNNERLKRQNGSFLICGQYNIQIAGEGAGEYIIKRAYKNVRDEFDEFSFRIPAESKEHILRELDFYNINEGSLFPELEHQMAYIKDVHVNMPSLQDEPFEMFDVASMNGDTATLEKTPHVEDSQIVRDILKKKINPILFDECYVAVQESLIPDWYNKEIGQSKARKALADTLQKYSSMERPMAKTVSKSIIDDIVDAITKELEKNQD